MPGCVSYPTITNYYTPEYKQFVKPSVGEITTISIGETMISQGTSADVPAIQLTSAFQVHRFKPPIIFPSGSVLRLAGDIDGLPIYTGKSTGGLIQEGGVQLGVPHGLGVSKDGVVSHSYWSGMALVERTPKPLHYDQVHVTTEDDRNFKQEIIYNGRNEDELFFTYREFTNDMARPAFTQSARYSIAESDIIGFKDLRLKVVEATNSQITYSIINPFN